MNVSTPSRLQDLHLPEMPDRPSFELPDFDMPDIDVSKIDVPKALSRPPPRPRPPSASSSRPGRAGRMRWAPPLLLAAGAVIAMNWTAVRARLEAAASMAGDRIAEMRRSGDRMTRSPSRPPTPPRSSRPRRPARSVRTIPTGLGNNGSSVADALDSEAYVGV